MRTNAVICGKAKTRLRANPRLYRWSAVHNDAPAARMPPVIAVKDPTIPGMMLLASMAVAIHNPVATTMARRGLSSPRNGLSRIFWRKRALNNWENKMVGNHARAAPARPNGLVNIHTKARVNDDCINSRRVILYGWPKPLKSYTAASPKIPIITTTASMLITSSVPAQFGPRIS